MEQEGQFNVMKLKPNVNAENSGDCIGHLPGRASHWSARWVVKSVSRAFNLINTLPIVFILLYCIFMPMATFDSELILVNVSRLTRAIGVLLMYRLCNAVRFVAVVTGIGLGTFLVRTIQVAKAEHSACGKSRRKGKRVEEEEQGRKFEMGVCYGPAALALNNDSNCDMDELVAPNFSTWLFDFSEVADVLSSCSSTGLINADVATTPIKEPSATGTSDESAVNIEVQGILSSRPTSTNTSKSCDSAPTLVSDPASMSPVRELTSIYGLDPRAALHSPPLPPLEFILQESTGLHAAIFDVKQSLAPWRQVTASAAASAPAGPDYLVSLAAGQYLISSPTRFTRSDTPQLYTKAATPLVSSYVQCSSTRSSLNQVDGVDGLHALSDAFISRRQEQWKMQRWKSLQCTRG